MASLTEATRKEQLAVLGLVGKGVMTAGKGVMAVAGGIKWAGMGLATQFSQAATEAVADRKSTRDQTTEQTATKEAKHQPFVRSSLGND